MGPPSFPPEILTGMRVDIPEPSSEECADEEGSKGDAQHGGQPQPLVCSGMRPSVRGYLPQTQQCPPTLPRVPSSLLGSRQTSFTFTSKTFSKMVLFCQAEGWGEHGDIPAPVPPSRGDVAQCPVPKDFGDQGCVPSLVISPLICLGGPWCQKGVMLTCSPALHLRVAEKGTCLPSGTV